MKKKNSNKKSVGTCLNITHYCHTLRETEGIIKLEKISVKLMELCFYFFSGKLKEVLIFKKWSQGIFFLDLKQGLANCSLQS